MDKTASESDDELFLNLPEYPDASTAGTSSKPASASKSKTAAKSKAKPPKDPKPKDPRSIPFNPPPPTTEKLYNKLKFQEDSAGFVHVYTDGSCEGNGKVAAAAGLGVYFGENHELNVSEPVTGRPTNNVGEIQAAIRAIKDAQNVGIKRLNIFTDSQFLINSICKWISGWKRKDWKLANGKPVANVKDFKELDQLIESGNMLIKWSYIPAHSGHVGNEAADKLAKIGANLYRTKRQT
jgi:ribonuclease HI